MAIECDSGGARATCQPTLPPPPPPHQARPAIFDLAVRAPGVLHEGVVEVEELVVLPLGSEPGRRAGPDPAADTAAYSPPGVDTVATTGETVRVVAAPDLAAVGRDLQALLDAGFRSLAVAFKHAALYPAHERAVGELARSMGFSQVSLSSDVSPVVKLVPRAYTAVADAYLTPHILRYVSAFRSGFDAGLDAVRVSFMQSDGGLAAVGAFSGHQAVLSGPAGGYVGYARTTAWAGPGGDPSQVIGFDMGGTSTDVSRFAGEYEHVFESTTAGKGGGKVEGGG